MDETKTLEFTRVLDAPVERVWAAWTEPEQIKKWWGPEGFTAPSAKNDLRIGGKYVYAMHGPAGTQWDKDMYSGGEYKEIVPNEKIVVTDYFCDEAGNKISPAESELESPDFPDEQTVTILFENLGDGQTKLSVIYPKPETEAHWQAILKSGMQEGWESTLNKLVAIL
jgi:uncharacterized protein YndB with AHSA1/START domain